MSDYVWTHLDEAQADGLACVMCELSTSIELVPVGRSVTGSQVFACCGACADQARTVVAAPRQP